MGKALSGRGSTAHVGQESWQVEISVKNKKVFCKILHESFFRCSFAAFSRIIKIKVRNEKYKIVFCGLSASRRKHVRRGKSVSG
jgi:hypothetical protein